MELRKPKNSCVVLKLFGDKVYGKAKGTVFIC